MQVPFKQIRVPVQRHVVENGKVLGKGHVVRQPRPGEWDWDIMLEPVVGSNDAIMHIGRMFRIVEEEQLAGRWVDFCMRRHTVKRDPALGSKLFKRERIEPISLAALIECREDLAGMDHHIGR